MRNLIVLIFFCIPWLVPVKGLAQGIIESGITARHFVPADGLPQIQITRLLTDEKGFLWVGTKFGVARWDGSRFHTFMPEDALDGRQVQHLCQGPGNAILVSWIGPSFSLVQGNKMETFRFPAHWQARHAMGIYPRDSTSVYVAINAFTDGKLYQKSLVAVFDLRLRKFTRECWLPQWWIGGVFPNGHIVTADWIPETGEFPRFYLYHYAQLLETTKPPYVLNGVHVNDHGSVRFFRKGDSTCLYQLDPQQRGLQFLRVPVAMRDSLSESGRHYLLRASDSLSYYTVPGLGLVQRENRKEQLISTLPSSNQKVLDKEGNLWVATENGLFCYYRQAIKEYRFNLSADFPDAVLSMARAADGHYFFSSYDHGFWRANESLESWDRMPWVPRKGLRDAMLRGSYGIRCLRNGGLLLPTGSGFIYQDKSRRLTVDLFGKGAEVFGTWEDTVANRVLISKHTRLFSLDLNTFQLDTLLQLPALGLRSILHITAGKDNLPVLVGSGPPLKWDGRAWRPIPGGVDLRGISACVDSRNGIWVGGVQPPALFKKDSVQWLRKFPGRQLVLALTTWQKWLVIGGGFELIFLDLDRFYKTGEEVYQVFDAGSGLTVTEGGQNSFLSDVDGSYWWPCQDKLIRFWPEHLITENSSLLSPELLQLQLMDSESLLDTITVDPNSKIFHVHGTHRSAKYVFGAAAMNNPANLRYRYRLNGYAPEWSEPVAEGMASFNRLPPGRYQFEMQCSRDMQNWSASVFSPLLVLEPFFWERYWFWILCASMVIGLVVFITLWASAKKRKETERQKQFNEMQLQAIRSKSLPHFTGNAFSNIDYFIEKGDGYSASKYLALMSRLYSVTLRDSDRPSRSLREELDYLSMYIEMEKLRFGDRLKFEIQVDKEVDLDTQVPNMVIHTFTENAVKHGISSRNEGGRIQVHLSNYDAGVEIRVEDDGVGRSVSANSAKESTKQGLLILQRQIALYNRTNLSKIQLRVEDLLKKDGTPAGTRYLILVPVNYRYK